MRTLDINGVAIHVINGEEKNQLCLDESKLLPIGRGGGLFSSPLFIANQRLSRRDLLLATGHDETKVDYAVPQDWWERNGRPRAYWSYEDSNPFGKPLYENFLLEDLMNLVLAALAKEDE